MWFPRGKYEERNEELSALLDAVFEAGKTIVDMQKEAVKKMIEKERPGDFLTPADLESNRILKKHLLTAFPDDGWLSEESVDDQSRLQKKRVWIADPIDGTREYTMGLPEYAISVALVEDGIPIVAAIFNPAHNNLFYAVKGYGAYMNDKQIFCRNNPTKTITLLVSRTEYVRDTWDKYCAVFPTRVVGSIAYKMGLIAAGQASAAISLVPKSEWDIAAGTLLISEAGGIVTNLKREHLYFNQKNVQIDGVVASARTANAPIFRLIDPRLVKEEE